eukprot:scaffold437_cov168-Ochromonas_danica.AAC.4
MLTIATMQFINEGSNFGMRKVSLVVQSEIAAVLHIINIHPLSNERGIGDHLFDLLQGGMSVLAIMEAKGPPMIWRHGRTTNNRGELVDNIRVEEKAAIAY